MFLVPQGPNQSRAIHDLEKRVEMLENLVKALQSEQRPRIGRPPKGKNEPDQLESGSTGRD
jgi:hypothetical protein